MIRIINQEEFKKCLPMLDSPDVECRLLGWELLCGCTDLHRDSTLVWNHGSACSLRHIISIYDRFIYIDDHNIINRRRYSSLIKDFITTSKIYLDAMTCIKLKYK